MKKKFKILSALSFLLIAPVILSSCSMFKEIMDEINGTTSSESNDLGEVNYYEEDYVDFSTLNVKKAEKMETTLNYRVTEPTNYTYYELGNNNAYNSQYSNCLGNQKTLVIPVMLSDYKDYATEENRHKIVKAFFGTPEATGWESVASYFYKSSYGSLMISGLVTPWFDSELTTSQLSKQAVEQPNVDPTIDILRRAVIWAKKSGYDMKDYDLDHDGYIDSVWLVYGAPYVQTSDQNVFWAYTYWDRQNANKNSPMPNTYAWASINFLNRGGGIDAHTFIHEHGHVMGLDDYYDYDYLHSPLGLYDMQDANVGDHNAFSKWSWGWINPVIPTSEGTITIKPFESSGQCIVIKNPDASWKGNAFDEYLSLELLTPTGLWEKDSTNAYPSVGKKTFTVPGIRMLHIDGRLRKYQGSLVSDYEGQNKLVHAYSNTPSKSMTKGTTELRDDLIAIVNADKTISTQLEVEGRATNTSLFQTGDVFTTTDYYKFFKDDKLHDGSSIPWKITFESVTNESATIRFEVQ